MKKTFPILLCVCLAACIPAEVAAWGLDIPIWTEGDVRTFDADYAMDGTMFVVFQPENGTEIIVYESRNRGYSWNELYRMNSYHSIKKFKLIVHDEEKHLVIFYREPNPNSPFSGKLVCFRLNWEDARTWASAPAMVVMAVSDRPVIENSFDACRMNDLYYAAWLEEIDAVSKRLRAATCSFLTLHAWTVCHERTFGWRAGSGTRVSIDVNPKHILCLGYCGFEESGYHTTVMISPNGGSDWETASTATSLPEVRYDPHVAAANIDELTAWTMFNIDRGDHQVDLVEDCVTSGFLPSEIWIADSLNVDEYVSDIENYRETPNEYVNLLYIRDDEGRSRTLYWQWASAADPAEWHGKTAVNDSDITSWPEDVAPKLVYSPGNWSSGGGAIFAGADRNGLYFDAPWNVTSANLLIVTAAPFIETLQPLVDWKNSTGIRTYVVDVQTMTDGRDSAESIKKGIDFYYRYYNVRHVMLFGDSELLPVRFTLSGYENGDFFPEEFLDRPGWGWNWSAGDSTTEAMLMFLPNYFATDLYYADLYDADGKFHDWDADGDGYFAEMYKNDINPENLHVYPEVAVGRIPCSNVQEAQNYIHKVLQYESRAFHAWWFNDSYTLANQDWTSWVEAARKTSALMTAAGFNETHAEHPADTPIDPAVFVNGSLKGMGFLLYNGHGAWGMGAHDDWRVCREKLPVVFHAGCGAGEYAPTNLLHQGFTGSDGVRYNGYLYESTGTGTNMSRNSDGSPPVPDPLQPGDKDGSYPEFLICRHPDRGAIVYYGANTGMQSPGEDHGTWFFEAFTKGYRLAGDMWKYAVSTYTAEHAIHAITPHEYTDTSGFPGTADIWDWTPLARFHQTFKYTLFGDPTLRVGGVPGVTPVSGIREPAGPAGRDFILAGNYPNPFNPATIIHFRIPSKTAVRLAVYNLRGQEVCLLLDRVMEPGVVHVEWRPDALSSGVYLYRLEAGTGVRTGRMAYIK